MLSVLYNGKREEKNYEKIRRDIYFFVGKLILDGLWIGCFYHKMVKYSIYVKKAGLCFDGLAFFVSGLQQIPGDLRFVVDLGGAIYDTWQ